MNGYEAFKTEFLNHLLLLNIPLELKQTIAHAADLAAQNFTFTKSEKAIIPALQAFPEVAKLFLVARTVEERSPHTIDLYKRTLTRFFEHIRKPLPDITSNDIRLYLFSYKTTRNVKNITVATARNIINNFFEWGVFSGYLSMNPAKFIAPIKSEKKPRSAMEPIELENLRSACVTLREKAIVDFLFSTGCRVSELCNAKLKNLDWSTHSVYIENGKGNVSRTVYLNAEAEVSLKAYLAIRQAPSDFIFTPERNLIKQVPPPLIFNHFASASLTASRHVSGT